MFALPDFANAIAGIESGGRYDLLGPPTKGDRAYGKYQVMGANVPEWTRAALGQPLTPEQFLASPEAQDAVFQHRFGQYVQKYGPEGAAKAWFAGEKGMNNPNARDVLGTSVSGYGAKFMKALGQPQPPMTSAPQAMNPTSAPQMAPGAVSPNSMPAYGWTPNNAPAQAQPSQTPSMAGSMPPAAPISFAPRRPPDIAALQRLAQLNPALAPVFRFRGRA